MTEQAAQDFLAITTHSKEAGEPARPSRFTRNLYVRCPAALPHAVEMAAQRQCMTSSEYVRQAIRTALEHDGARPVFDPHVFAPGVFATAPEGEDKA